MIGEACKKEGRCRLFAVLIMHVNEYINQGVSFIQQKLIFIA